METDVVTILSDESNDSLDLPDVPTSALFGTSTGGITKRKSLGSAEDITKKKSDAALAREAKKQKVAEEKAAKKNANDMNKIYKPGECMKYMNVEGHPTLLACWWCGDLTREVTAAGAKVVPVANLCHPSLVVWSRNVPRTLTSDDGEMKLTPSVEQCNHALYVTSAEELAELVSSQTLASHLAEIKVLVGCALTLVVYGITDYFKSKRRRTMNSNRSPMTEIDLELAITDLLVSAECDSVRVNTPSELALFIVQFTKALAEAPHKKAKRACEEEAEFYMKGDSKKCIAVDKDGVAVGKLWQQMIAILPNSSLDISRAICAKYKTPIALFEALQSPNGVDEVANIGVSRAGVPGSSARRIGPEFARKLCMLFTECVGSTVIN